MDKCDRRITGFEMTIKKKTGTRKVKKIPNITKEPDEAGRSSQDCWYQRKRSIEESAS